MRESSSLAEKLTGEKALLTKANEMKDRILDRKRKQLDYQTMLKIEDKFNEPFSKILVAQKGHFTFVALFKDSQENYGTSTFGFSKFNPNDLQDHYDGYLGITKALHKAITDEIDEFLFEIEG